MRIFFSFQKVWSLYYCMSLSRSRIMRYFFTSVQTKMPTSIFVRDRIQLYLAKMAIFDKMTKWPYLSPEVPNPKNKGTFLSSTLKVEESKVPLFFGLEAPGQIYGPFLFFLIWLQIIAFIKMTKWPYLSPEVPNPKNKGTFFSSTFKVGEKNVPLFFLFVALESRYGEFLKMLIFAKWSPN